MRRFTRQRPSPFKAPRLFTMLSLLVCLLIVMINLRSFREPRPGVQRIISNLDQSLKQVNDNAPQDPQENAISSPGSESAKLQTAAEPSNAEQSTGALSDSTTQSDTATPPDSTAQSVPATQSSDPPAQDSDAPTESEASNQSDSLNFNLREDLELQDWMGLIQDGALSMQKLEMPAYWRVLGTVKRRALRTC